MTACFENYNILGTFGHFKKFAKKFYFILFFIYLFIIIIFFEHVAEPISNEYRDVIVYANSGFALAGKTYLVFSAQQHRK